MQQVPQVEVEQQKEVEREQQEEDVEEEQVEEEREITMSCCSSPSTRRKNKLEFVFSCTCLFSCFSAAPPAGDCLSSESPSPTLHSARHHVTNGSRSLYRCNQVDQSLVSLHFDGPAGNQPSSQSGASWSGGGAKLSHSAR